MSTEYLGVERAANNEVGSIVTEKWLRADECEHAIVVENGRVRWRGGESSYEPYEGGLKWLKLHLYF